MSDKLEQVNVKDAVKMGAFVKKMNMTEVARAIGKDQSTLSGMLKRGRPNWNSLKEVFEVLGVKVIIEYPNGNRSELI